MKKTLASIGLALSVTFGATAYAQLSPPPVEAYGDLQTVRGMSMSPDGRYIAFIKREQMRDFFTIAEIGGGVVQVVECEDFEPRGTQWAGSDYAILIGTKIVNKDTSREFRFGAALSMARKSGNVVQLLNRGRDLASSVNTNISYVFPDEKHVLMTARTDTGSRAFYKVNLKTGKGRKHRNLSDRQVLLSADGEIDVEIDYDRAAQRYEISRRLPSGESSTIWLEEGIKNDKWGRLFPQIRMLGYTHDRSKLLVSYDDERSPDSLPVTKGLTFDGEIVPSGLENPDGFEQTKTTIVDSDGLIIGVEYEALVPSYEFFDDSLNQLFLAAQATFPDSAVRLVSADENQSRIIIEVSGGSAASEFYMLDRSAGGLTPLGRAYPNIPKDQVGYVEIISYSARDGLEIPALVTWPPGIEPGEGKDLPMIVLPHGGPEAHDELRFDWMAQLPASRGAIVVQPQFRGSDGFGREFRDLGRGKWGREMQDDVSDAVLHMIDQGYADPERVCIFGWSYGGYSAMAGATFSPELYRCVIAGAGVSDLPKMLFWEVKETGQQSPVVAYWNNVIGDRREDREKLKDISPVNFTDRVQAPVLLLHGDDDDVVPIEQSRVFYEALRASGKDVKFVELTDEDHWMSTGDGRMTVATEVNAFLSQHLAGE
ncbi:MAG: S9 family peptidase [Hyphomonadaceae bacterium]|nr:S9 family peptidase [Hyphomonadaceae bacterium]